MYLGDPEKEKMYLNRNITKTRFHRNLFWINPNLKFGNH